jgi:hypothetical protein
MFPTLPIILNEFEVLVFSSSQETKTEDKRIRNAKKDCRIFISTLCNDE